MIAFLRRLVSHQSGPHGYGRQRYRDMEGESLLTAMRRLVRLRWAKEQQPSPVVKYGTADRAKVGVKR